MSSPAGRASAVEDCGWIILREPGRWSLTSPGRPEVDDISLGSLQALAAERAEPTAGWALVADRIAPATFPPLDAATTLVPTPVRAIVVVGGRFAAERLAGGLVPLDDLHLELLDALAAPTTVQDLWHRLGDDADGPTLAEVAAAAAGLVGTGLASAAEPPTPGAADPTSGEPATASDAAEVPDPGTQPGWVLPTRFRVRRRERVQGSEAAPGDRGDHDLDHDPEDHDPGDRPHPHEHSEADGCGGLVPVYAFFGDDYVVPYSLGVLTAALRGFEGGRLEDSYCIHRPSSADEVLAAIERNPGPAVLLCSDYMWCVDFVLEFAAKAKAVNPNVLAIHGGPSAPSYEADARQFCRQPAVDLCARGESEGTLPALLEALAPGLPAWDLTRLESIPGLSFWHEGRFVRTGEPERLVDPGSVPSPWLSGEFDEIEASRLEPGVMETNRGCPYSCTFCDWGAATNSRIRFFDMQRVRDEFEHFGQRGIKTWLIADANFGITSRDVEIAEEVVKVHEKYGVPNLLIFTLAKNTTKHLKRIVEMWVDAGILPTVSLSLQTRDPDTLAAVERANIGVASYDELTSDFRRTGLPLVCDLLIGLPGATVETYREDVQFCMDHNLTPRSWPVQIIPNAPMNDPAYRSKFKLVVNNDNIVVASVSFTELDHAQMMRIRMANQVFEHFGIARVLMRYLQWDHEIPASRVLQRIAEVTAERPDAYPLLSWLMDHFETFIVPPVSWPALYDELRLLLVDEFAVVDDDVLRSVIEAQRHLMPDHGRSFPDVLDLPHDLVSYWQEACAPLEIDGSAAAAVRPLTSYGPGRLEIAGDPCMICTRGLVRTSEYGSAAITRQAFWQFRHFELDSPMARNVNGFRIPEAYVRQLS